MKIMGFHSNLSCYALGKEGKRRGRERWRKREGGRQGERERINIIKEGNKGVICHRPEVRLAPKAQALIPSSILIPPRFCREQTQKKKGS